MTKRHQVTKLEKYETNKKLCSMAQYLSVVALAIEIAFTLAMTMPIKNMKDLTLVILNFVFVPATLSVLVESVVGKYFYQRKIDDLEETESKVKSK